ncbi:MAG: tRNA (adenosine(37)-N6)-threonylcarbamoyltransferase complex transferase subunit TsaD [Chromatiales bacterium]|nr:tRNA (adenosine(37)-N6)-threonylcarbamoyltransferase complex transferase subunit TsaD [Chromatiales bacterium]
MGTLVLGIETSCDETGIGLVDSQMGVVGEALFSQIDIHREYGGVVPELASRDHIRKLLPLLDEALGDYRLTQVDAVAYTAGPGLIGALLTGAVIGHSLAWALDKPAFGIHHLEAHILACLLENPTLQPPYLALLVSGGHTQLIEVLGLGKYSLLGETLDDAVGEAFDKVAKMLSLPYPGGPAISQLAEHGKLGKFEFTSPMVNKPGLDFSFSGLKTQVMNQIRNSANDPQSRADIALAFEISAVNALIMKSKRALQQTSYKQLVVAGGVAANRRLRNKLKELAKDCAVEVIYPKPDLCMDNGVMIAHAGMLRLRAGQPEDLLPQVNARWSLSDLQPLSQ